MGKGTIFIWIECGFWVVKCASQSLLSGFSNPRLTFAGAFLGHVVVLLASESAQEAEALLRFEMAGGGIGGGQNFLHLGRDGEAF